jgi:hypothetical protein
MQWEFLIQCFGVIFITVLTGFLIRKSILDEENRSKKLMEQYHHAEAEMLSKKLKDSKVEIAVKKPQAFTTKRKPQKKA